MNLFYFLFIFDLLIDFRTLYLGFILKRFILYDIQVPEGMLEHGIRQYLVDSSAKGTQIVGRVMRIVDHPFGPSILVIVTSTRSAIENFERDVLSSDNWVTETQHEEPKLTIPIARNLNVIKIS